MRRTPWAGVAAGGLAIVALLLLVVAGPWALLGVGGASGDEWRHSVIIDAGSSGSRVYIYKWHTARCLPSGIPNVTSATQADGSMAVLKLEPGLSWYKDAPQRAAASLAELVRFAEAHVPRTAHASTPIHVFSTAGLRMLPAHTRSAIEREVRTFLAEQSPFLLREDAVQVIPGHREALFVWIAANYGLGKLSDSADATLGCLDMGGASAQVAYEVPPTHVLSSANTGGDEFFTVQSVWGRRVYAGTLDGFGANEARRRYVDALHHDEHVKPGEVGTDPCLPPGLVDEQRRPSGGVISLVGTGDFDQCFARSVPLLRSKNLKHSFSDTILPHPAHPSAPWLGISEFWYTMDDVFKIGGAYDAAQFRQKARVFCGTEWSTLSREYAQGLYPKAKPHRMKYQCFKSAWLRAMLHEGYRFPAEAEFSSTSVVNGLPVQWTLGAVLFTEATSSDNTACTASVDESVAGVSAIVVGMYVLVAGALAAAVGIAIARRGGTRRPSRASKGISMA